MIQQNNIYFWTISTKSNDKDDEKKKKQDQEDRKEFNDSYSLLLRKHWKRIYKHDILRRTLMDYISSHIEISTSSPVEISTSSPVIDRIPYLYNRIFQIYIIPPRPPRPLTNPDGFSSKQFTIRLNNLLTFLNHKKCYHYITKSCNSSIVKEINFTNNAKTLYEILKNDFTEGGILKPKSEINFQKFLRTIVFRTSNTKLPHDITTWAIMTTKYKYPYLMFGLAIHQESINVPVAFNIEEERTIFRDEGKRIIEEARIFQEEEELKRIAAEEVEFVKQTEIIEKEKERKRLEEEEEKIAEEIRLRVEEEKKKLLEGIPDILETTGTMKMSAFASSSKISRIQEPEIPFDWN